MIEAAAVPAREETPPLSPLYFAEKPNPALLERNPGVTRVHELHQLYNGLWCAVVFLTEVDNGKAEGGSQALRA